MQSKVLPNTYCNTVIYVDIRVRRLDLWLSKLGTYLTEGPRLAVDEEEDEDGDVALDESDWLKLLRRSNFSLVRNPSILAILVRDSSTNTNIVSYFDVVRIDGWLILAEHTPGKKWQNIVLIDMNHHHWNKISSENYFAPWGISQKLIKLLEELVILIYF